MTLYIDGILSLKYLFLFPSPGDLLPPVHFTLAPFCALFFGDDQNLLNDTGRSPLFRASFNGHNSTVQLLLEAGGDASYVQKAKTGGPTTSKELVNCRCL